MSGLRMCLLPHSWLFGVSIPTQVHLEWWPVQHEVMDHDSDYVNDRQ